MGTEPDARAAERLLRRLSVAIKTAALYGAPHPMTTQATEALDAVLRAYMDACGPFEVRVTKRGFAIGSTTFDRGADSDLAFYLYTRKLSFLKVMPDVSREELTTFLSIVSMDRVSLESAGGPEYLLWQGEVRNIQVTETALGQQELLNTLSLNVLFALLGRGRLSPQEREVVIEILRLGPDHVGMLLDNIHAAIAEVFEGIGEDEHVQHVYQALRGLDRIILDEPFEDQPVLYANLAAALLLVSESLRPLLGRMVLTTAGEHDVARVIVNHLDSERLAQMVLDAVSPGDIRAQVAGFLRVLFDDREKAKAILSILEVRLRPPGEEPAWLSAAVWPGVRSSAAHAIAAPPPPLEFDDIQIPVGHEESHHRLHEAAAIDDDDATREVAASLVDVLRYEDDEMEIKDLGTALEGYLPWMLEHQEFALLGRIIEQMQDIATTSRDSRSRVAAGFLKRLTEPPLFDGLLAALWAERETAAGRDVVGCLEALGGEVVRPLVRVLGEEPRAAMRAMLCDLLVQVGRNHVNDLGAFIADARWYLVRNIANILGRTRNPQAIPYLDRLAGHHEYRVRREVVDALTSLGTEDAQARLVAFLDDPDERIRLRTVQSLDAVGARRAMPRLVALLTAPDLLNRRFPLRQAVIETVERVGAREALPALRKLAGRRLVFGSRGVELRRLARRAVSVLEGPPPAADGGSPLLVTGREQGSTP
ncbi:MAG: HEAT repeat domain-containing protein [Armatimonadota bacterium]|nr:HEAT repeat domain-containing protein [Armatimonadota bacterium]